MKKKVYLIIASLLWLGLICSNTWASKESVAEFYKKNTVTLIVGSNPGGGADFSSRLIANFWNVVTGGTMVVKNMPGAGGLVGMNYMAAAKPDGLTLGLMMYSDAFLLPYLTKNPAQKFDMPKMNYLISAFNEPLAVILSLKKNYRTIEDLQNAKGLKQSTQAPYTVDTFTSVPFLSFLDLDVKIVSGYKSAAEKNLALGKGEADIEMTPLVVAMRGYEAGFNTLPIVIMADERMPFLPDTPAFPEIVDMTPEQRKIYEDAAFGAGFATRMIATQEKVDLEKVAYLRDVLAQIMALPELQEQAKVNFPYGAPFIAHDELDAFVDKSLTINIDQLKALLDPYLGIK